MSVTNKVVFYSGVYSAYNILIYMYILILNEEESKFKTLPTEEFVKPPVGQWRLLELSYV